MPFPYSNDDPENDAWTIREVARGWLACIGAATILALTGWGIAHHVMATKMDVHRFTTQDAIYFLVDGGLIVAYGLYALRKHNKWLRLVALAFTLSMIALQVARLATTNHIAGGG
jgi:uncharacterized membrane protein (DUF2068 family)